MVAPITLSPGNFSTGVDSPVAMDWSTKPLPSTTTPSVGIFSPGLTTITSPTFRFSTGISLSSPSTRTLAVLAPSCINFLIASPALFFARASINLPVRWTAIIMAPTPAKLSTSSPAIFRIPVNSEASVPSIIKTSMLGVPPLIERMALLYVFTPDRIITSPERHNSTG